MICTRKVLVIFICVFLCASFGFAQKILIPFREKNLWGYADTNGVIQIKPAYDRADFFNYSKPTAKVFKDRKKSLVDTTGKLLFPFSDKFEPFGNNFIVIQDGKKGLYSSTGKLLIPVEYDRLDCSCYHEEYRSQKDKMYAEKNGSGYLVSIATGKTEPAAKPKPPKFEDGEVGIVAPLIDVDELVGIPYPQYPSSNFPALIGQKNLVHRETILQNTKPVFYVFGVVNYDKKISYVGQNGVLFFKD